MNKLVYSMPLVVLLATSVFATMLDHWSVRGDLDENNVYAYFGNTFSSASGSVNAHFTQSDDGNSGAGSLTIQGKLANNQRERFSVNWASTGNNYGFNYVINDDYHTTIQANARTIKNGIVTYGVPTTIIYYKTINKVGVYGPGFSFFGDVTPI